MKRIASRLLSLFASAALITAMAVPAMAAETAAPVAAPKGISVQLDGKNLSFTDAVPEVNSQRTFLPFRSVFEAMGAQVDYEASTNTVVAVKDGKTLRMVVGQDKATITENGATSSLTMDVAAYAKNNRTYVPVRFAAQAFGCAVGWDQDDQTVIVVDMNKLLKQATSAYHYTYLEKYAQYAKKYETGTWAIKGSLNGTVSSKSANFALPISATMNGVTADTSKIQMAMNMKMDMTSVMALLGSAAGSVTAADKAMLESLKSDGISMDIRGDLTAGKMYMNLSGKAAETAGIPAGTWFSMDMNAAYGGMDYAQIMSISKEMKVGDLITLMASSMDFSDKDGDYLALTTLVNGIAKALADESFVKSGNDYTTSVNYTENGQTASLAFTLTMADGVVTGYKMSGDLNVQGVAVKFAAGVDAKNHMDMTMKMAMADDISVDMTMTADYAVSSTAPSTAPPAGATVLDINNMLSAMGQ